MTVPPSTPAASTPAPAAAPSTDLAPRPADKTPVAFGVKPVTLDEAWRWASQAAKSTLVPKAYHEKPHDIMVAVQMGVEVGLPPMTALQSIGVINGRPALWGDGLLGLIMASPLYEDHAEYFEVASGASMERRDALTAEDWKKDTSRAVCTFVRRHKTDPVTKTFSVGQAKKANLLGKEGPWQTYPDRMLQMRARSFAARDAFPDVLRGLRSVEEVRDIAPDDDVIDVRQVQRRSARLEAPAAAPEPEFVAAGVTRNEDDGLLAMPPVTVTGTVKSLRAAKAGVVQLRLTSGEDLDVAEDNEDALAELKKFAGTDHAVRFTCRQTGDRLRVVDFRLAE